MIGRRRMLVLGLGGLVTLPACWAAEKRAASERRSLELKNLHTGEVLNVTFDPAMGPDGESAAKLQHCLRDYRANEEHQMDAALYGLLLDLAASAGYPARYEVISGYRSPHTNAQLHAAGHAVAEHSMHMEGRAIDVRLLGCDLERLRDAALDLKRGGVGFYPSSNFVHVDTGRVRTWTGR